MADGTVNKVRFSFIDSTGTSSSMTINETKPNPADVDLRTAANTIVSNSANVFTKTYTGVKAIEKISTTTTSVSPTE